VVICAVRGVLLRNVNLQVDIMRIIDIFTDENCANLYTVLYDFDDRDSLTIAYEELTDTEKLYEFFKKFKVDFEHFYNKLHVKEVVDKTASEVDRLFNMLADLPKKDAEFELNALFKPLDVNESEDASYDYQQLKAYGEEPPWIRLYAVRYGSSFVFTGAAIKLTQKMKERPHTKFELVKLEKVSEYLENKGILGQHGFIAL
jgi:hypothetical protein